MISFRNLISLFKSRQSATVSNTAKPRLIQTQTIRVAPNGKRHYSVRDPKTGRWTRINP